MDDNLKNEQEVQSELNTFFDANQSESTSNSNETLSSLSHEFYQYQMQKKQEENQKNPLILAVWGLLLGVLYGFGLFLSISSLILLKVRAVKFGTTYKWTIFLAVLGIILSVIFIATETLLLLKITSHVLI